MSIPSPSAPTGADDPLPPPPNHTGSKVVVAVHGIGDQTRFATIRSVAYWFAHLHGKTGCIPLGQFHRVTQGAAQLWVGPEFATTLGSYRFAEVYWADVPEQLVQEAHTLEETKAWARTVLDRFRSRRDTKGVVNAKLVGSVLDEMIDAIRVLERIFFLAEKAGIFTFDLGKVLTRYLGDVQVVTEFQTERTKIIDRLGEVLSKVFAAEPNAEIYVVGHSEGSVVALLGLLTAAHRLGDNATDADAAKKWEWIKNVRGLMTIGSPIDKHLVLWPELWDPVSHPKWAPQRPISWRNYYDYGDPVGFELEHARSELPARGWDRLFDFTKNHDHGFARYPLPGKAHNDYWTDPAVFEHFLRTVVEPVERSSLTATNDPPASTPLNKGKTRTATEIPAPACKRTCQAVSYATPYALALLILLAAIYVGLRGLITSFVPDPPEAAAVIDVAEGGVETPSTMPIVVVVTPPTAATMPSTGPMSDAGVVTTAAKHPWRTLRGVGYTVGALLAGLAGVMFFSRVYCLTNRRVWRLVWGAIGLAVGLTLFALGLQIASTAGPQLASLGRNWPVLTVIAAALALGSAFVTRTMPDLRLFPVLIAMAVVAGLTVWVPTRIHDADRAGPLWPAALGFVGFLYLSWLATLLFDLAFVWHRYIRWSRGRDVARDLIRAG